MAKLVYSAQLSELNGDERIAFCGCGYCHAAWDKRPTVLYRYRNMIAWRHGDTSRITRSKLPPMSTMLYNYKRTFLQNEQNERILTLAEREITLVWMVCALNYFRILIGSRNMPSSLVWGTLWSLLMIYDWHCISLVERVVLPSLFRPHIRKVLNWNAVIFAFYLHPKIIDIVL